MGVKDQTVKDLNKILDAYDGVTLSIMTIIITLYSMSDVKRRELNELWMVYSSW